MQGYVMHCCDLLCYALLCSIIKFSAMRYSVVLNSPLSFGCFTHPCKPSASEDSDKCRVMRYLVLYCAVLPFRALCFIFLFFHAFQYAVHNCSAQTCLVFVPHGTYRNLRIGGLRKCIVMRCDALYCYLLMCPALQ